MSLRKGLFALALSIVAAAPACGGAEESIVLIGGRKVDAISIDRDPLAMLPAGVIALGYLDASAMFATGLGPDVSKLVSNLLPVGPESNFVASRDVQKLYGGVYAMQGADFCVVLQGTFDTAAIARSADARVATPSGVPLVKSRYADSDVYTAGNIGFVALTGHTILSGNETGLRRALDRLRRTKLERSVPAWMIDLMSTKGAAFSLAGDLSTSAPAASAAASTPLLAGMRMARVIGNFQPPGLNFAGTLTYADDAAATNGQATIENAQQVAQFMSIFSALGFGISIPPLQLKQSGKEVGFTMPVDEKFARVLLGFAVASTRVASVPSFGGATTAFSR